MEQDRGPRAALLRTGLSLACGAVAACAGVLRDVAWVDAAAWGVLAPILVAGVLELLPRVRQRTRAGRRHRAQVVVPDAVEGTSATPDPARSAGDHVPPAVRDELLLRDRPASAPSTP